MAWVPDHALTQFGLPLGSRRSALFAAADGGDKCPPLLLNSPEARRSFRGSVRKYKRTTTEEYPAARFDGGFHYTKISFQGTAIADVARFSPDLEEATAPPGDVEATLLLYWLHVAFKLDVWREEMRGKTLVVRPSALASISLKEVLSRIAAGLSEAAVISSVSPALRANEIEIGSLTRFEHDEFAATLLEEALGERNYKWRFLGWYRVLENGYLHSILENIKQTFYDAPKEVLQNAANAVANEIRQLSEHAERQNLQGHFSAFQQSFEDQINRGSQFCIALEKASAEARKLNNAHEHWRKGLVHCYKIRCAIAHAGSQGLYIERFKGWRDDLERLLPPVEALALASLEIRAT